MSAVIVDEPVASLSRGEELHRLAARLFPICRSDWERPGEWKITDADITNSVKALNDPEYDLCIASTLAAGPLNYGDCFIPGETEVEVLISTHICHPSPAHDNHLLFDVAKQGNKHFEATGEPETQLDHGANLCCTPRYYEYDFNLKNR